MHQRKRLLRTQRIGPGHGPIYVSKSRCCRRSILKMGRAVGTLGDERFPHEETRAIACFRVVHRIQGVRQHTADPPI